MPECPIVIWHNSQTPEGTTNFSHNQLNSLIKNISSAASGSFGKLLADFLPIYHLSDCITLLFPTLKSH